MLVSKYIISSEGVQHFIEEYLFQHKITYTSVLCCVSLMSRFMMKNVTVIKFKKMFKQKYLSNKSMFNKILHALRFSAHRLMAQDLHNFFL